MENHPMVTNGRQPTVNYSTHSPIRRSEQVPGYNQNNYSPIPFQAHSPGKVATSPMSPKANIQSQENEFEAISKDLLFLKTLISRQYKTFPYIIASANVFLIHGKGCSSVPAEIGLVKFSFSQGIIETFTSLISPKSIPKKEIPNVIEMSNKFHKIPHEKFDFPNIAIILRKIHKLVHQTVENQTKVAYIFVEDSELEQMKQVFNWFEAYSMKLDLNLVWNVQCIISTRVLFIYLKDMSPLNSSKWKPGDELTWLKNDKYNLVDLCYYHQRIMCPHCANSKAFGICYLLFDYFCTPFGINVTAGSYAPMNNLKFF